MASCPPIQHCAFCLQRCTQLPPPEDRPGVSPIHRGRVGNAQDGPLPEPTGLVIGHRSDFTACSVTLRKLAPWAMMRRRRAPIPGGVLTNGYRIRARYPFL